MEVYCQQRNGKRFLELPQNTLQVTFLLNIAHVPRKNITLENMEPLRKHRYQTVLEQQLYNPALSGKMDPEGHFRRRFHFLRESRC